MACWDKVEAKIKATELIDHPADFYASQLREKKAEQNENCYIKNNKKQLKVIESEWFNNQQARAQTAKAKREFETRYEGKLPAYLVQKKKLD